MPKKLIAVDELQVDMLIGKIGELLDLNPYYFEPLQEVYDELVEATK